MTTSQSGDQSEGQSEWKQRLQRLYGSGSFWLLVLRAKWVERNAGGWERNNNAACRAVESIEPVESVKLVESVELVGHTTWSGHVQYVVVGVLHGL